MRIMLGAVFLFCGLLPSKAAEGTEQVMKEFGLLGTWSPDCGRDASHGGERATFSSSFLHNVSSLETKGGQADQAREVNSAVRVTEGKVKISIAGRFPELIQKVGQDKIVIIFILPDGRELAPHGILEKCLN